jgi:transposase-like protein
MGRSRNLHNPACARCGAAETVSKGKASGRQRWRCLACGRSFGETLSTPLYGLKTDIGEIVRALQVVLHRGSLRAAEEQTGHNYETIATWLRRIGAHAEAMTDLLARDLHLTEVEVDELWSFVGKKGDARPRRGQAILRWQKVRVNAGDA